MPGAVVVATRLLALRAAMAGARFVVVRRFDGRVVRFERDFGAMIPPTLAVPTMPRPGSGSHAEARFPASDVPGTASHD
jgi:hypothetical protein